MIFFGKCPQTKIQNIDIITSSNKRTNKIYFKFESANDSAFFQIEPIEWIVLEENTQEKLMISKKILFATSYCEKVYNRNNELIKSISCKYKDTLINKSVNTFIKKFFSKEDMKKIIKINGSYASLLTLEETKIQKYMTCNLKEYSGKKRISKATDYCSIFVEDNSWWLMQDVNGKIVKYIDDDGIVCNTSIYNNKIGVRLLIKIKK